MSEEPPRKAPRKDPEPAERLTRYAHSADFPPREIGDDADACAKWYREVFYAVPSKPTDPSMTDRERYLYSCSAAQYVSERRAGRVTCEEYATALVKRARYYRYMNQWIYNSYALLDQAVETAREMDKKAAADGIEAIAPFYGLPIPMKGTAAVVQYPSGAGSGVLSGYTPVKDSALTAMIRERHGIILGATNVPEFAFGYRTANPASGHTRNPYNHKFTVGGSSGGAASAVAAYMCPVAVTEDTGGSTRVPATCNQNFGFDPSRNHYPNEGNPGLSYVCDQLGLNARSIEDIILFDLALGDGERGALHEAAKKAAAERAAASIKIGVPEKPFAVGKSLELNPDVRQKLEEAKAALGGGGFTVLDSEWRSEPGRLENVIQERLHGDTIVNGKKLNAHAIYSTSLGQMATFVFEYLDAPVSAKEVIADCGRAGFGHKPGKNFDQLSCGVDESQLRYLMGPWIKDWADVYNSYFTETGADLIMFPSAMAGTPDLDALAGAKVPLTPVGGSLGDAKGDENKVFQPINNHLKFLHIPKMVVPTGLTADGRPTAVQLWGRAVPYDRMFDDKFSADRDAEFLHLVQRVAAAIQESPALRRVDASAFATHAPGG